MPSAWHQPHSVRDRPVILHEQLGIARHIDLLDDGDLPEVFVQDPSSLRSSPAHIDGDVLIDRELEELLERRQPVGVELPADVGLDQHRGVEARAIPTLMPASRAPLATKNGRAARLGLSYP